MIDTKLLEGLIHQQRGEQLEYRPILPTSKEIAQIICSFANTEGGFLVFGLSNTGEVIGLSADFQADIFTGKALRLLKPTPITNAQYFAINGKKLFVITIEKSESTIRLDEKKYIRVGAITKLSEPTKIILNSDGSIIEINKTMRNEENTEPIKYNAYDINLTESYGELEKQLKDVIQSKTGIPKEEYLTRIKNSIESYCQFHKLGSLEGTLPIILRYPAYNYHAHLAFHLMTFDVNKIGAVLDYQHENFIGIGRFQKLVEHGVYDWIQHNSPFDNTKRLRKIMEWVEKRKEADFPKNKIARKIGNKILEKFRAEKAEAGHLIMMPIFQAMYNTLEPQEKKLFQGVLNSMWFDGYIQYDEGDPKFIRLGEAGYNKIYQEEAPESINEEEAIDLPVVVILTAIGEEFAAVRAHLTERKIWTKDKVLFEQGTFVHAGERIAKVFIRECGPKNANAAQEAQRALTFLKPECILFVGIAGSKKPHDFKIGDVIFPEKVHYYEGGKSELNGFKPRSDDVRPTFALYEIAKMERHNPEWKTLIKSESKETVSANLGVIASGDQVVEHYDSEIGKILSTYYGDSACIEMEGYGFLNAIQRQGGDFAIDFAGVVRGVSDIVEQTTENPSDGTIQVDRRPANAKILASESAAAFAYWLILKIFTDYKLN